MANGFIFARFGVRNGATRLLEQRQSAPLKIARAFPDAARRGGLEVCVMDASPGLLAGDHHRYEWELEAGAQVRIISQGATRVHPAPASQLQPSPRNSAQLVSRQTISAHVGEGARLELWPEAIIPFRGAALESRTEIWLDEGAEFVGFECLSAGRIARGERFEFECVCLQTRVFDARGPRFCAQNRFIPARLRPHNRFGFGERNCYATLISFSDHLGSRDVVAAEEAIKSLDGLGGASLLARCGVAVSLLTMRAQGAKQIALEIESRWNTAAVSRETAAASCSA